MPASDAATAGNMRAMIVRDWVQRVRDFVADAGDHAEQQMQRRPRLL